MAVTSYGRNKNHDDEIKKTKRRRPIIAPAIAVRLLKKINIHSIETASEVNHESSVKQNIDQKVKRILKKESA